MSTQKFSELKRISGIDFYEVFSHHYEIQKTSTQMYEETVQSVKDIQLYYNRLEKLSDMESQQIYSTFSDQFENCFGSMLYAAILEYLWKKESMPDFSNILDDLNDFKFGDLDKCYFTPSEDDQKTEFLFKGLDLVSTKSNAERCINQAVNLFAKVAECGVLHGHEYEMEDGEQLINSIDKNSLFINSSEDILSLVCKDIFMGDSEELYVDQCTDICDLSICDLSMLSPSVEAELFNSVNNEISLLNEMDNVLPITTSSTLLTSPTIILPDLTTEIPIVNLGLYLCYSPISPASPMSPPPSPTPPRMIFPPLPQESYPANPPLPIESPPCCLEDEDDCISLNYKNNSSDDNGDENNDENTGMVKCSTHSSCTTRVDNSENEVQYAIFNANIERTQMIENRDETMEAIAYYCFDLELKKMIHGK